MRVLLLSSSGCQPRGTGTALCVLFPSVATALEESGAWGAGLSLGRLSGSQLAPCRAHSQRTVWLVWMARGDGLSAPQVGAAVNGDGGLGCAGQEQVFRRVLYFTCFTCEETELRDQSPKVA